MTTAYDARIIAWLEQTLAPGGRSRLSPLIQATQVQMLCGETPDPTPPAGSIRAILTRHAGRMQELAQAWITFCQHKHFHAEQYQGDFLPMYLALYCPINIAKLQWCLLDLVRQGALHGDVQVLDVGAGTGTTLLAILDFLITWAHGCALYGASFPVTRVTATELDQPPAALAYAQQVVATYATQLEAQMSANAPTTSIMAWAASWARDTTWVVHDLNAAPYPSTTSTLLVASYVLNELTLAGTTHLGTMLSTLPTGGIAMILEPGDQHDATHLMAWRHTVMTQMPQLTTLGPCGTGHGSTVMAHCMNCWNARHESLYQSVLHLTFRRWVTWYDSQADTRMFTNDANNLLSWSYVLLQAGDPTLPTDPPAPDQEFDPDTLELTCLRSPRHLLNVPPAANTNGTTGMRWNERVHFCSTPVAPVLNLAYQHDLPVLAPRQRYGSVVRVQGWLNSGRDPAWVWLNLCAGTEITPLEAPPTLDATFLPQDSTQVRQALRERLELLPGSSNAGVDSASVLAAVIDRTDAAVPTIPYDALLPIALLLPGVTLVVAPPDSLLLCAGLRDITTDNDLLDLVTVLDESVAAEERWQRLDMLGQGFSRLVFLAPALLDQPDVCACLQCVHQTSGLRFIATDATSADDLEPALTRLETRLAALNGQPRRLRVTVPPQEALVEVPPPVGSDTPRMIPSRPVARPSAPVAHTRAVTRVVSFCRRHLDRRFTIMAPMMHGTEPLPDLCVIHATGRGMLIRICSATARDLQRAMQSTMLPTEMPAIPLGQAEQQDLEEIVAAIAAATAAADPTPLALVGMVLFPNIATADLQHIRPSPRPAGIVWAGREILSPQTFREAIEAHLSPPLTDIQMRALRTRLSPEAVIPTPLIIHRSLPAGETPEVADTLLDYDQEWAVKVDISLSDAARTATQGVHVRLINGVAGSGKSLILLHRAHLLHHYYPHKRFQILTHNRALIHDLAYRYRQLSGQAALPCRTFLGWCKTVWPHTVRAWPNVVGQHDPRLQRSLTRAWEAHLTATRLTPTMFWDEICWLKDQRIFTRADYLAVSRTGRGTPFTQELRQQVFSALEAYDADLHDQGVVDWGDIPRLLWQAIQAGQVPSPQIDVLLVDEAQFFAPLWIEILQWALTPRTGSLFLVADPTQGFLKRRISWKQLGLDVRGQVQYLTRSYRTTRAILHMANQFYLLRQPHDRADMVQPVLTDMRAGTPPCLLTLADADEEQAYVVTEVTALMAQQVPPAHILVIHATWQGAENLRHRLSVVLGAERVSDPRRTSRRDTIRVCSLHAATGLEGAIVFLVGLQEIWASEDHPQITPDEQRELVRDNTRKLYMAMTRAGQRLVMTGVGAPPAALSTLLATSPAVDQVDA